MGAKDNRGGRGVADVLVTGGTGFIGRHLVDALSARGERVRVMARHDAAFGPSVVFVRGDVTEPASMVRALDGVNTVYHVAGATRVLRVREYERVNVGGTRCLIDAATRLATPPRVVYLSSLSAGGPSPPDRPRHESDPPAPASPYGRSKWDAEVRLRESGLAVTAVRSSGVVGPGDPNSLALFRTAKRGIVVVPGKRDPRVAWVDVSDLVEGLILAAERGERMAAGPGSGVYHVAMAEQPPFREAGRVAAAAVGRGHVRTIRLPSSAVWGIGLGTEFVAWLTNRPGTLTRDRVADALAGSWTCTTDKANRDLGFVARTDLTAAFVRTAAWYRERGWL